MRNICCAPEPNNVQPADHLFLWTWIVVQQLALNVIEHSTELTEDSGTLQWLSDLVGTTLFSNDLAWALWANIFYLSHA